MYSKRKGDVKMKKIIAAMVFTIVLSTYSFAAMEEVEIMEYKNVVETEISGYAHDSRGNVEAFGYNVPLKINYNDSYKTQLGYPIDIDEFTLVDGVPTLSVTVKSERPGDLASFKTTIRCYTSKEAYTDLESEGISSLVGCETLYTTDEPLTAKHGLEKYYKENTIIYIEVWIDEYDYSQK